MLVKIVDTFPKVWKRTEFRITLSDFFGYNDIINRKNTAVHIIYEA